MNFMVRLEARPMTKVNAVSCWQIWEGESGFERKPASARRSLYHGGRVKAMTRGHTDKIEIGGGNRQWDASRVIRKLNSSTFVVHVHRPNQTTTQTPVSSVGGP